eukprot:6308868-Prorocentrum_lima.AAC.1
MTSSLVGSEMCIRDRLTKVGGPPNEPVVARTTINVDSGEVFKSERIILNVPTEELTATFPRHGKHDSC